MRFAYSDETKRIIYPLSPSYIKFDFFILLCQTCHQSAQQRIRLLYDAQQSRITVQYPSPSFSSSFRLHRSRGLRLYCNHWQHHVRIPLYSRPRDSRLFIFRPFSRKLTRIAQSSASSQVTKTYRKLTVSSQTRIQIQSQVRLHR